MNKQPDDKKRAANVPTTTPCSEGDSSCGVPGGGNQPQAIDPKHRGNDSDKPAKPIGSVPPPKQSQGGPSSMQPGQPPVKTSAQTAKERSNAPGTADREGKTTEGNTGVSGETSE